MLLLNVKPVNSIGISLCVQAAIASGWLSEGEGPMVQECVHRAQEMAVSCCVQGRLVPCLQGAGRELLAAACLWERCF